MKTFDELTNFFADEVFNPETEPVMFFVGAGISRNSGLPLFNEFTEHIVKSVMPVVMPVFDENDKEKTEEYNGENYVKKITDNKKGLRPEVVLQSIYDVVGNEVFDFYKWFDSKPEYLEPNCYHYYLAKAIKGGNYVFTPNVDVIIEDAYRRLYGEKCPVAVIDEDYTRKFTDDNPPTKSLGGLLFKVHGSVDNVASIRFLLKQVGRGVLSNFCPDFEYCIKNYKQVFIGYSGADHFSNQPILEGTPTNKASVWFFYKRQLLSANDFIHHLEDVEKVNEYDEKSEEGTIRRFLKSGSDGISEENVLRNCKIVIGDTSAFFDVVVKEIKNDNVFSQQIETVKNRQVQAPPIPSFCASLKDTTRYHIAALLLFQLRELSNAEKCIQCAYTNISANNEEKVKILRLWAEILAAHSGLKYPQEAIKKLQESIMVCTQEKELNHNDGFNEFYEQNELESTLGIVNYYRRMADKAIAITELDKANKLLVAYQGKYGEKEWWKVAKIRCQTYELLLELTDEINDEKIGEILKTCTQLGDVQLSASTQNTIGLKYFFNAQKEKVCNKKTLLLKKAEQWLNNSLQQHSYIGDGWGKFRNFRNLGLIFVEHAKLAENNPIRIAKLKKALEYFNNAKNSFPNEGDKEFLGEKIEARFRIAETCQELIEIQDNTENVEQWRKDGLTEIELVSKYRKEQRDEHNLARILNVKCQLQESIDAKKETVKEIINIYDGVVNQKDEAKKVEWFSKPYRTDNAMSILKELLVSADSNQKNEINSLLTKIPTIDMKVKEWQKSTKKKLIYTVVT